MNYQAADHLLELFVAELDLIDVGGSGGLEEIGAQGMERQIIAACRLGDAVWSVALIDQAEKGSQRLIQVSAVQTARSEEHTSELQSRGQLVCRLLLDKKKITQSRHLYKR